MLERKTFKDIWEASPPFFYALSRASSLSRARHAIMAYLASRKLDIRAAESRNHPLEWIVIDDSVDAMKNIFSERSEELAGVSALEIFRKQARGEIPETEVSDGFLEEFYRLLLGVENKSGIYDDTAIPEYLELEGREAALERSADLDNLYAMVRSYTERYPSGLDEEMIEQRTRNQKRILKALDAEEEDWDNWQWHMRNVARDAESLAKMVRLNDEEKEAIKIANEYQVPFAVTPYYASLMEYSLKIGKVHATRAQVIPPLNYVRSVIADRSDPYRDMDFMGEHDTSPIDLITRRYPMVAIIKPYNACFQICVYCQRNWELLGAVCDDAVAEESKLDTALDWLGEHSAIREVLITGGDPFVMSNERIKYILDRLAKFEHVKRIRFGTRALVVLPQRVTEEMADLIASYHEPPNREVIIVTHFEHSAEVTPEAMEAVLKFKRRTLSLYNQQVFTFANSRRFETVKLRLELRHIGIDPYYTFNAQGKRETRDYRVPIARLQQERKEEARLLSGMVRTDVPVYNVPRLGKNNILAWQHHRLIMVLPNGRRVYEFHPWEKKISPVDTYLHTDVSIYEYLQRLEDFGEDLRDYETIWYYF